MREPTRVVPRREPPPGGKALARLQQFETERELGLSVTAEPGRALTQAVNGVGGAYYEAFKVLEQAAPPQPAVPIPNGWRPIGPFCIPHGQTYGSGPGSRPSVAGRIGAVAVDPSDGNHILIGAAGGGVWETRDRGDSWAPRSDGQPSLATGAIGFDPSNPMTAYAGTGEGNFFRRLGAGLLRSVDGGATWAVHATAPFMGRGFYDLIVDPLDGNHLLAALDNGLFESTDGGVTWTARRNVATFDLSVHPPAAGVPTSTDEVFAACMDGVFRSTDGGTTWAAAALPGAPANFNRVAVAHSPSDGNVVYVYGSGGGAGFIWRRDLFAGLFTAVAVPAGLNTGQDWYDWFLAVAPNNSDVIYLGEITVWRGVRGAGGVFTWTNIAARPSPGDSIHPDQHAIAFDPIDPNVVYVGNDGGIYRSPDAGTTWHSLNTGLSITEFEYLAQHPQFEAWLLGGTQDNGTQRFEGEEVWYHVQDGDGGDCDTDFTAPYTCFHSFYGMGLERSTTGGGWGSWTDVSPPVPANYAALFYPPFEANGPVLARAGQSVFISTDDGTTWPTNVALPAGSGLATALSIPNATRVYAGTQVGRVFRIDQAGGVWTGTLLTTPRNGFVSDILVDPTNANRIWVTYSSLTGGHVFRSDDGGTTWVNVSAGLPNISASAIVLDPAAANTAYVGMDVGVWRTTDAGATWTSFSELLPNALVKDLVFHQPSRLLRAATQSRGVWERSVDAGTMPDVEVYLRDSSVDTGRLSPSPSGVPDPFSAGSTTHWWQCTDIKVDSPGYQVPGLNDVDFERFEDDHGIFAAGLIHENTQRNRTVRVYVEVHNRGLNPALTVDVKVFFADASAGLPALPAGFWTNFPNNALPPGSPWQQIAAHKTIPQVATGQAEVVGFDWPVPGTAADHTCLLAIISAANDDVAATGVPPLDIGSLVLNSKKAGLKNLTVVNPPPSIGPRPRWLVLRLWGEKEGKKYDIGLDRPAGASLRAVFLSRGLARQPGVRELPEVKLTASERAEINRLTELEPGIAKAFDFGVAYGIKRAGPWLRGAELDARTPQPILLMMGARPRPGHWSVVQWDEHGREAGGFTFLTLDKAQ
jgi:photosystem II stability/assembly factor-like uncharacterized protein